MVLMGYVYSVIEAKVRLGRDQFPDFDFNQLGVYLLRGVWPLLVSLVVILPVILVMTLTMIPFVVIFATSTIGSRPSNDPPWFFIVILITCVLVFGVVILVLQVIAMPMTLRAGLSQDFRSAFSMVYVRDFLGKMWKEMLLSLLFLIVTAPFVLLAGLLLLFIGMYPATVILQFARFHFHYQLYELYLQRGGTPIPLKDEPGAALVTP
jgi:hypothetical protein